MDDKMTKTSFRLSVSEKDLLNAYAEKNDLTVSQVIRRAIREYLNLESTEE